MVIPSVPARSADGSVGNRMKFGVRSSAAALVALYGVLTLGLSGCSGGGHQRTIAITSEPAGATVWLNDVEIGRTPVESTFRFYGTYDVRLSLAGYEPVLSGRTANPPPHEWVGLDLVTAGLPLKDRHEWHFVLQPVAESVDKAGAEAALRERAVELRAKAAEAAQAEAPVSAVASEPK
ncbi:MAG: PEGA domain-containing protein [Phycisphaerales bacterium]